MVEEWDSPEFHENGFDSDSFLIQAKCPMDVHLGCGREYETVVQGGDHVG